jgi:hypothetical protein
VWDLLEGGAVYPSIKWEVTMVRKRVSFEHFVTYGSTTQKAVRNSKKREKTDVVYS